MSKAKKARISKNVLPSITTGSRLDGTNGSEISAGSYKISPFIPINSEELSISCVTSISTVWQGVYCLYDDNHAYISGHTDYPSSLWSATVNTNGAAYIRISTVNDAENIMINEGSSPLPYEPYGATIWEPCAVKRYHNGAWIDGKEYVRGRYPNIFDVDSVQNIIRNNMVTTSGFSNVGGVITLTKSVGNDGRYAYNELLNFEANEVYEITFDVLLEGTNSSSLISIAVLDPLNMGAVSTDLFNYHVEKDTWTSVAEELTLSATQGALSIQARNTGNSIKIKNVILRKKGHTWNEQ